MSTVTVVLDWTTANQLIAAGEQRIAVLEEHVANGVPLPELAYAIAQTGRGVLALRYAAGLVNLPDFLPMSGGLPLPVEFTDWTESEKRFAFGDR